MLVASIVVFVLFTPREWFHDQARPSSIAMVTPSEKGVSVYWMDVAQMTGLDESATRERATALLRERTGRAVEVIRVEPIFDSEKDIKGYMAFAKP